MYPAAFDGAEDNEEDDEGTDEGQLNKSNDLGPNVETREKDVGSCDSDEYLTEKDEPEDDSLEAENTAD